MTKRDVQNLVQANESPLFRLKLFIVLPCVNRAAVREGNRIRLVRVGENAPKRETR
jgi:P pilus assembly chaperone PapD